MTGCIGAIEAETLKNTFFRRVVSTAGHTQLVVTSLLPGEEIGSNDSQTAPLRLYTLYSTPNHPEGTVHRTKADAAEAEAAGA